MEKLERDKIRDYLEGKMNPKDRHALENASMNDPFLFQALEGLDENPNWEEDINLIEEKILEKINKRSGIVPIWRILGIAAGFIMISGFAWFYFLIKPKSLNQDLARKELNIPKPQNRSTELPDSIRLNTPKLADNTDKEGNNRNPSSITLAKKMNPPPVILSDPTIKNPKGNSSQTESINEIQDNKQKDLLSAESKKDSKSLPDSSDLKKSSILAVNIPKPALKDESGKNLAPAGYSHPPIPNPSNSMPGTQNASGLVSSRIQGLALVSKTNKPSKKTTTREDSLKDINELILIKNGLRLTNEEPSFPIPMGGISHFNEYVQAEVLKDTSRHGIVTLRFQILPNGKIAHIKVLNSTNKKLNEEAKKILLRGPTWKPGLDAPIQTLEDKIKFP